MCVIILYFLMGIKEWDHGNMEIPEYEKNEEYGNIRTWEHGKTKKTRNTGIWKVGIWEHRNTRRWKNYKIDIWGMRIWEYGNVGKWEDGKTGNTVSMMIRIYRTYISLLYFSNDFE